MSDRVMRPGNQLLRDYLTLRALGANPQRRGRELEPIVERLLRRSNFTVQRNVGVAKPRQTDLLAKDPHGAYLVEVKWTHRPADVGDVGSLYDRLGRAPNSVTGLLISVSGFTHSAVEYVEARRNERLVMLVDGTELEQTIDDQADFGRLLRHKKAELFDHGRVLLASRGPKHPSVSRPSRDAPTESDASFVAIDGTVKRWITSTGRFGEFTFSRDLRDIDWLPAGGSGVTLDLDLGIETLTELSSVLAELTTLGRTSGRAHWSIAQSTLNWHGMGAASLIEALSAWQERYEEAAAIHHTESLCYVDICEGGFYTLTADLQASSERRVWHAYLSFQLSGIPLNQDPLRHLCETLGVEDPYFRPRSTKSIESVSLRRKRQVKVRPAAFIVQSDIEGDPSDPDWVSGVVVENPYYHARRRPLTLPDDAPTALSETSLLVCDLRSHHPRGQPRSWYQLTNAEWAWTSEALVLRVRADWVDYKAARSVIQRAPRRSQVQKRRRGRLKK